MEITDLASLLKRPTELRDEGWRRDLLLAAPDASLAFDREVMTGPDGFPYVGLRTEASAVASGVSTLRREAIGLTDAGLGAVLEPRGEEAAWVFGLGDLATLRMFGALLAPSGWSSPSDPELSRGPSQEVLSEAESTRVGSPNEAYLPSFLRPHLARYLQGIGIADPYVALVLRQAQGQRLLAFETGDPRVHHHLQWFLPNGYATIDLDPATVRQAGCPLLPPGVIVSSST